MNNSMATWMVLAATGAFGVSCAASERPRPATAVARPASNAARPTSVATRIEQGGVCDDWQIYFATGSHAISSGTRVVLERLAACIRDGRVREVTVTGSADPRGTVADNQELGHQRADAIRDVLVANGCRPGVVRARSQGETEASGARENYAAERGASVIVRSHSHSAN